MSPRDIATIQLESNKKIINASIKMMMIDGNIDNREMEKIAEIYFYLFNEHISLSDVKELIFEALREDDYSCEISEVANSISNSIEFKKERSLATEALAEVMLSDGEIHALEKQLIYMITDLWGTTDILEDILSDY
tara:strand:+ start:252 stop:659 length:408 start_codon:yes stop_codon:yes gene_type:complete